MSERMPAEVWIGGSIAPSLASDLCAAIAQQVVSVEWGDEFIRPDSSRRFACGGQAESGRRASLVVV